MCRDWWLVLTGRAGAVAPSDRRQSRLYGRRISTLAFPDDKDLPAERAQRCFLALISGDVGSKLLRPKRHARFRRIRVLAPLVAVPEAAVDKHSQAMFRKHQVRATG